MYSVENKEAVYITDGANRSTESQVISVPDSFEGDMLFGVVSFISENGKQVANSKLVEIATP